MFELRYHVVDDHFNKNSLVFCRFMSLFIILFAALALLVWGRYFNIEEIQNSFKLREFFKGLKGSSSIKQHRSMLSKPVILRSKLQSNTRKARLFTWIFLIRRFLLILMIVTFDKLLGIVLQTFCYTVLQVLYIMIVLVISPFKDRIDSITIKMNEFLCFIIILSFFGLHDKSKWNPAIELIFIGFIMANNVIV